ncbi:oxygen-independent coproporphyrinogen III oxidase, partial [Lishizhenia sp.]|uniref:oxygen-independent coproporphyrinogen III oxidase n=1 Tax=Lishizhenia sp. TaxID=2497594 RepID=UPI00299F3156
MSELIRKYNQPGPRYTSYPTVPFWKDMDIDKEAWKNSLIDAFKLRAKKEVSLYIHLPFCEQLCTFCGCHKRITKNHAVEEPYLLTILKEWQLYTSFLGEDMVIKEIHLGGGTPTFFQAENLARLINGIKALSLFDPEISLSFEAHPNNTTEEHLKVFRELGFNRLSFGIQDYDPLVQKTINRIQSFEQVKKVHTMALDYGFNSVSHDIIYGLPHQTLDSIKDTINKTAQLRPHRISFYSYAHVPWIKGVGQRGYNEDDLPKNEEKQALYEYGKEELLKLGYQEIGMDHFALPEDELSVAHQQGKLHRNFMGYTTQSTEVMIGLGM